MHHRIKRRHRPPRHCPAYRRANRPPLRPLRCRHVIQPGCRLPRPLEASREQRENGAYARYTYQYAATADRAAAGMIPRPIPRDDTMLVAIISDLAERAFKVDLLSPTPRLVPTPQGNVVPPGISRPRHKRCHRQCRVLVSRKRKRERSRPARRSHLHRRSFPIQARAKRCSRNSTSSMGRASFSWGTAWPMCE
jgi:hypothetical protein